VRPLGLLGLVVFLLVACLPTRTRREAPVDQDDAGPPGPIEVDGGPGPRDAPEVRPHAVLGIDPPHGPFSGGTLADLRGNGFGGDARIWFGDTEVDRSAIVVRSPERIQVTTPPGAAGPVDVIIQNGDDRTTRALLRGGFTYDDLVIEPSTGPTAGGTIITVRTQAPLFDADTTIEVDLAPCEVVELVSTTELDCRTPPGTPGAKRVRALLEGGETIDVLDAFTYVVSADGFRGGLSGGALAGELSVLVLSDETGDAIPGATVLAGDSIDTALAATTDGFGTALVSSPELGDKVTVTVAKSCFQPITFVDVPVERVTVFSHRCCHPSAAMPGRSRRAGATLVARRASPARSSGPSTRS
jgi:hypothetical protein